MKCPNKDCNSESFSTVMHKEAGDYNVRTKVCKDCKSEFNTFEMIIPPNSVIKIIPEGDAPFTQPKPKSNFNNELTFSRLSEANLLRDEEVYKDMPTWTTSDWGLAFAGEAGETCNKIKKLKKLRDKQLEAGFNDVVNFEMKSKKLRYEIAEELADTIIYADLLAQNLCIDLSDAIVTKFNSRSKEENCTVFL